MPSSPTVCILMEYLFKLQSNDDRNYQAITALQKTLPRAYIAAQHYSQP